MITQEWRKVLEARSVKDKISVAIDCDIAPVGSLNTVAELVRDGYMVWIDRAVLPLQVVFADHDKLPRIGVNADIYKLTDKGVALCEAEGIAQR